MAEQQTEQPQFMFEPGVGIDARVVDLRSKQYNEQGAESVWGYLTFRSVAGTEHTVKFSCAPWLAYLHGSLREMAQMPEQAYTGFHLQTNEKGYHNLVGLGGIAEPADWEEQRERLGLGSKRAKSNGRAALPPPGAPASGSSRREAPASGGFEDEA